MGLTILVIGATGNTGKSVVRNLPTLLESHSSTARYRVLGLTRSLNSPVSQNLAVLPHVEMQEKDWTTIHAAWLKSRRVVRVYIAPHKLPHQFVEVSAVEYISPTNPVSYGRSHWAIENLFTASYLASTEDWIKTFRETASKRHWP
ncbi:hypothetical protein BJX70DRAFT_354098 [Aspergillus crustosus]